MSASKMVNVSTPARHFLPYLIPAAAIISALLMNPAAAANYGTTIGVFSSTQDNRLDIGTGATKMNVPASHDSWATRLKILPADGSLAKNGQIVADADVIGVFSENGQWRLDIGTAAMKVNTPGSHNSWATRLKVKKLNDMSNTGPIRYGDVVGVFSEDGYYRLDIGTWATKQNIPASSMTWATMLQIVRLENKSAAFSARPAPAPATMASPF